tara:strand:+ start:1006 stop:1557 length:552 start_codon:yes stop_codon:yes gene_type:complete
MELNDKNFDAPIPGENYTAETKNYPWHRPPDIVDYDEAIDYSLEQLSSASSSRSIMALLSADISLPTVVDIFITSQISKGKFPIDLGILIAGPIAKFLEIMAKMYDIDYTMGKDNTPIPPTPAYLKEIINQSDISMEEEETVVEELQKSINPSQGLMGAPTQIEQQMMLGQDIKIEEENEEIE